MAELTCPGCQATFDVDGDHAAVPDECPFCGADLTDVAAGLPPPVEPERRTAASRSLPPDSKIVMLAPEPGQLIFQIPPGKGGAGGFLIFFGALWLGITSLIAGAFAFGGAQNQDAAPWMLVLFFAAFFLIGIGTLVGGLALKFLQTMLLIERHRVVMQKSLFGYESYKEMPLAEGARATLVESYRQNEQPVYAVAIVSGANTFKFGTSLADDEKEALLAIINDRIGYEQTETVAEAKNPFITESKPADELAPEELSDRSLVTIETHHADELVISLPLVPSSTFSMFARLVAAVMGVFAVGMIIFTAVAFGNAGGGFPRVVLVPFLLMFPMPFFVALLLTRLRVTIGVNREQVVHRVASGPFGRKKTYDAMSVTGVTIRSHAMKPTASRSHRRQIGPTTTLWSYCSLDVSGRQNWLAFGPEEPFCREVAGLVKYQLRRIGNPLLDVPAVDSSQPLESSDAHD